MGEFVATQVALERHAMALLQRSDVEAAVARLSERWRGETPGFLPETYAQLRSSIAEVALLVALQVVNGDPRRPQVVEISAGPHHWGGVEVPGGRWGINNPDTLYFAVPIEAASHYVLRGRRRGVAPTDLNVSVQTPDVWGTLDSLGRHEIVFDTDGGFAITVGDHVRHQLPIRDGGSVLLIRQTLADWASELPYELSVVRTAGPDPAPPVTDDHLAELLVQRLGVVIDHNLYGLQAPIFALGVNTIPQPGPAGDKPGYLVNQRNTLGYFRLSDDEALLLEVTLGGAGYAAVAAPNVWGVTADSARHRNSLNNHQVEMDSDGRFAVVVSNADPGLANWLDPGGAREGIVMLRWQLLDETPNGRLQPGVTARHLRLDDLAELAPHLQAVPAAQRRRQLAERAAGYARRFALR